MIVSVKKAQQLMIELQERLTFKLANQTAPRLNFVRAQNDLNGYPMLFLSVAGNEAEAQPVIALRIKQIDGVSKDIFNNALNAYNPHTLEFAYEADATAQTKVQLLDIEKVMWECARPAIRILVEAIASGTAVTEASMNASTPAEAYDDLYWPLHNS